MQRLKCQSGLRRRLSGLLRKHEALSVDPQHLHIKLGVMGL